MELQGGDSATSSPPSAVFQDFDIEQDNHSHAGRLIVTVEPVDPAQWQDRTLGLRLLRSAETTPVELIYYGTRTCKVFEYRVLWGSEKRKFAKDLSRTSFLTWSTSCHTIL